jgi:polysaccharide deacetylase
VHYGSQFPDVALDATTAEDLKTLAGFAEFWKIPYATSSGSSPDQVLVTNGKIPESTGTRSAIVISPSSDTNARKISDHFGVGLRTSSSLVHIPFSRKAETSIQTRIYSFTNSKMKTIIESNGTPILSRLESTNTYLLSIDLVSSLALKVSTGLEDPPSFKFKMATRLPFSYRMIPSFVRNRAFRKDDADEAGNENVGPIECLRAIFLASLISATAAPIPFIGFWKRGKRFGAAVSHDVETGRGLDEGSKNMLSVENELGVRSTWNIVTSRYPLTRESLIPLAQSGEIGAHDTDHDGRLIFLSQDSRIKRLKECRETLEKMTKSRVRGFRAPLLQHDTKLLEAVGKAGYSCDSSVPSWELLSPTSLKPHGVGTVFPLQLGEVIEVPVSLSQDHQLLRVRGLSPSEAGTRLVRDAGWISEVGGLCTVLVHPDYEFAAQNNTGEYSRVLKHFSEDPSCQMMTLAGTSDWWSHRQAAKLASSGNEVTLSSNAEEESDGLCVQVAKSFDKNGFSFDEVN